MLSREDNELLCRVGPGTPMGNLLRRFWMPALLEEEIAEPDSAPKRLRLMGEDLVAFRDTNGDIGILDAYCPHRCAPLFFGRNEESGLRCIYHGWKFDFRGNCVDMPSEPQHTDVKHKIKQTSYPALIHGGVVWTYMGPSKLKPALPQFEWSCLPAGQRTAIKRLQQCNWAQAVEGGIDSSHVSFLHSRKGGHGISDTRIESSALITSDRHPVFTVKEIDHGLLIGARRNAENDCYYWRITQFLLPFYTMIPPLGAGQDSRDAPVDGHAWVPIDDYNTWTWSFSANPHRPYTAEEREFRGGHDGLWGPVDEHFMPRRNKANDYLIDRPLQRNGEFAGIIGIPNQDAAVQEGMGPIANRSREHLGTSDKAIIAFRQLLLRLARGCAHAEEPAAAYHGEWYSVRAASALLGRDVPFEQGAASLLAGAPRRS